jgi:adenosylcobinamide-GDP ribazoletransferase
MSLWESVKLAFAMFSRVPVWRPRWEERNMRYMMAAFPLVGVLIGFVMLMLLNLGAISSAKPALRALIMTLVPIFITGGVHLDGLCDTADALASHAAPQRRREILKDPHAGAFAIIYLACWLLAYFALSLEIVEFIPRQELAAPLCLGFVLSRVLSGLAVLSFPPSSESGLARTFRVSADKRRAAAALSVTGALCIAAMLWLSPAGGGTAVAISGICFLYLYFMSKLQFGGMSGDLAGWFLQICELAQLAAIVIYWDFLQIC